jgi:uncharacterized protein (TIGR03067 family)
MAINLTGKWRAVYSELNGEMAPVAHVSGIEITFEGDTFSISVSGSEEHSGTYMIDDSVEPARIHYVYMKSSFYKTNRCRVGIIQLTGSTFKDCLGGIGAPAPKSFTTTANSDTVMTIHQRVGAEGGSAVLVSASREVSQW